MIKELVNSSRPVAIYHEIMADFTNSDVAVNCGQILMCDAGGATLHINFRPVSMQLGSIVMMRAGDIVRGSNATPDYAVTCLAYDASIMREASFRLETVVNEYLTRGFTIIDSWAGTFFHRMVSLLEPVLADIDLQGVRDIAVMQVRSFYLMCYHRYVLGQKQLNAKSLRADEIFGDFFALLIANHQRERSVNFYARKLNITPRYLNQTVTKATGHSAKQVIDDYVTAQLKLALQVTSKSITEIAWQYNFESLPFFSGYFKKRTGFTPQSFRSRCNL